MLKNFVRFLSKNFTIYCAVLLLHIFPNQSFAKGFESNNDIIKEIEKSLLFDQDSREKINVYNKNNSIRKSDYTIGIAPEEAQKNDHIQIVIVDSKSGNFDVRKKERLAYNSALVGQYEVSIALYKEVLRSEPENKYSKFALAVVYQKIGQFHQAKELYQDLLKDEISNQEEVIGNLLAILIEESPKDSLYLLSRLMTQNPRSAYILAQAAIVYDKMNKTDQAITLLNRAIEIEPINIAYKYNLAIMYDKTSQTSKALSLYADVSRDYLPEDHMIAIDQVRNRIKAINN